MHPHCVRGGCEGGRGGVRHVYDQTSQPRGRALAVESRL